MLPLESTWPQTAIYLWIHHMRSSNFKAHTFLTCRMTQIIIRRTCGIMAYAAGVAATAALHAARVVTLTGVAIHRAPTHRAQL